MIFMNEQHLPRVLDDPERCKGRVKRWAAVIASCPSYFRLVTHVCRSYGTMTKTANVTAKCFRGIWRGKLDLACFS